MAKKKDSETYKAMLENVETIVREVGAPEIDLDVMVDKIESGYDLIKKMRQKLDNTKSKVDELREQFDSE
jgi:exodeoxyribonuclease VII small subunit